MNQIIKKLVYSQGSEEDAKYIAHEAGLNEVEQKMFWMLRSGATDITIQEELDLGDTFKDVENAMRVKVATAVMYCVKFARRNQ